VVQLAEFYTGVRKTVIQPDEMMIEINFPALAAEQSGTFVKIGLRRAQAISVVNAAVVLTMTGERVLTAVITLGSVAPTIVRASEAETFLAGKKLDPETCEQAARLAQNAARPIGDVRGSASYRLEMTRVAVLRGLRALAQRNEKDGFPQDPVLLWRKNHQVSAPPQPGDGYKGPIVTQINGKEYVFQTGHHKSLLRLLREDAGLVGTKEGCAEGECGACTVLLDGMAVMSCLVPAPRAHGAEIVTVEGLALGKALHPVQQSFVEAGAVQCGYCTPGFLMSAAALLEEHPQPTREQIMYSITGNLCRCTGYYKIVEAIKAAAQRGRV
jgi:carbon-monoxide dehydrogenase medium subunit